MRSAVSPSRRHTTERMDDGNMDQFARSPVQLGTVLRRRRRQLGRTQAQLSLETGLRQATLSSAEAGAPMHLATLFRLLAALDLEIVVRPRKQGDGT